MASPSRSKGVCQTCGYKGIVKHHLICVQCNNSFVHRYCLDNSNPHDNNVDWKCEDCAPKASKVNSIRKSERIKLKKDGAVRKRRTAAECGNLDTALPGRVCSVPVAEEKRREVVIGDKDADKCIEDSVSLSSSSKVSPKMANCSPPLGPDDNHFTSSAPTEEKKNQLMSDNTLGSQGLRKKRRRLLLEDEDDLEEECAEASVSLFPLNVSLSKPEYLLSLAPDDKYLAQPLRDHVWRGAFGRSGGRKIISGLLAHLSSSVCSKTREAAEKLPSVLNIEVLPRMDVWPKRFQTSPPTDDRIALYFFPESRGDEKIYDSVVDHVTKQDLALKACIDDIELFVFSSCVLPQQHWRIRTKYYLWGVFKRRRVRSSNLKDLPVTATKNRSPSSDLMTCCRPRSDPMWFSHSH